MEDQTYSRRLGPPLVASAIAVTAVANFCVVNILASAPVEAQELFNTIWPIQVVTTVAIILVMSFLYKAVNELISELEGEQKLAKRLSCLDPLTGLANRRLINERLSALQGSGKGFSLILLDLDRFKQVNDVQGHPFGDELLKIVAKRIKGLARQSDTVARLGGDEFFILQAPAKKASEVESLCHRLSAVLSEPISIGGKTVSVGCSIGYVLSGSENLEPDEYIRRADIALYKAKSAGRNRACYYSQGLDGEIRRRAHIEEFLRKAIITGEGIEIHFQPQLAALGEQVGVEALLRCHHPSLGHVSPSEIIPVAEETGLIDDLGVIVFRQACAAAQQFPHLSVAVNISPSQILGDVDLPSKLKSITRDYQIECQQMELEITETVFLGDDKACKTTIEKLKQAGFRIALDDFGTGYSSLSSLRNIPVDRIKLDKSLIDHSAHEGSVALLRAAVGLAHTLGIEVIAEGIETVEQERIALEAGCDGFQGFRYGKAVPPTALAVRYVEDIVSAA